ncbi:unnamed protein product [Thlaspi arvense]|uniref:Uncharacterized protein n=1 Tax=Thlaspi arvense TaxID=13288 RepID=A0AAU9R888_THLAR|nr:unnamed protein product [Thlaspi arvense]
MLIYSLASSGEATVDTAGEVRSWVSPSSMWSSEYQYLVKTTPDERVQVRGPNCFRVARIWSVILRPSGSGHLIFSLLLAMSYEDTCAKQVDKQSKHKKVRFSMQCPYSVTIPTVNQDLGSITLVLDIEDSCVMMIDDYLIYCHCKSEMY